MLEITVPAAELWDEINNQFIYTKKQTLTCLSFKMGIKMV